MMELLGYLLAVAIGVSLGLIGGGGSVLTIPVLVYFFDVEPVLAGGYSLFVVGTSSLFGAVPKFRQGSVDLRAAMIFGIPSLLTVILSRRFILPAIPQELFTFGKYAFTRSDAMMILFAVLMIAAARAMMKGTRTENPVSTHEPPDILMLSLQGAAVGVVTGLLGAGGGFLIIPALTLFSKLPMKVAVGTSLLIIAVNSFFGFFGNWSALGENVNWLLLLAITTLAVAGIFIGNYFGAKTDGSKLKKGFAVFVFATAAAILIAETLAILT